MQSATRLMATGLAFALITAPSLAQPFEMCTAESDGSFTPRFQIEPSMVVHTGPILDLTRNDLALGGVATEGAFSFNRTVGAILRSAGAADDQAAKVAFVQNLLDTMVPVDTFALNSQAGIQMPVDPRAEQSELDPEKLLDASSDQALKPLALFNRFDLAPDNWSHCGEYRIVYGKADTDGGRFLLIFEAMVPNPGVGEAGCRPIAEFWANLTDPALSDSERAARLSAFYYEGKTSPTLASADLRTPVVDYHNYGGDGGRGQVRGNLFMEGPWQLREWLTRRTFDPAPNNPKLTFVPVTVKDSPLAELHHDSLAGTPLMTNNIPASVNLLQGQFIQALTSTIGPRLLSETTAKHQDLVASVKNYHLGTSPVTEDTILLNTIALGNDDKFNEFQSTSQGFSDAPGQPAGSSTLVTALLNQLGGMTSPFVNKQSGEILLNRARAVTCAGCHMTAARSAGGGFQRPGVIVLDKAAGPDLEWPDVLGFVHVDESRALSPTLTEAFLPFRRYVLSRYLCKVGEPIEPVDSETIYEPTADMPPKQVLARAVGSDLVNVIGSGSYFVGQMVNEYAAKAGIVVETPVAGGTATAQTDQLNTVLKQMSETDLAALRQKVSEAIALARNIELKRPGAFVETRRPH
ncbi:hypothetical protein [Mesorhizobium sp.]|uniref:hypothetical protein n=1 Tax=Mesorhizobium sp. TaxID=1871066 RepID=UPI00120FE4A6|nr:hypothetical protein [Mesorhizobium sp.]TIT02671.1 MAG: hypothetical protein E5W87_09155 [Mesorhizobium sp.]